MNRTILIVIGIVCALISAVGIRYYNSPKTAQAWIAKGAAWEKSWEYDWKSYKLEGELKCYEQAIKLSPDNAVAWRKKGGALFVLGRNDEALEALDKCIKLDPNDSYPWGIKGLIFMGLKQNDNALASFDKSIQMKPTSHRWFLKGQVLNRLDRCDEAIKAYEQSLGITPQFDSDTVLYNKAHTHSFLKDKENALSSLSQAIAKEPYYKEKARKDKTFKWLWEDEEFKRITEQK